jgi:hypothetical protein
MTPPLVLRKDDGECAIIEVDHEIVTDTVGRTNRSTVFLTLAPGLRVQVGSRCLNKHRVTSLRISPANGSTLPRPQFTAFHKLFIIEHPPE